MKHWRRIKEVPPRKKGGIPSPYTFTIATGTVEGGFLTLRAHANEEDKGELILLKKVSNNKKQKTSTWRHGI